MRPFSIDEFANIQTETEADIQRKIVQTLRALGCVVLVVNQTGSRQMRRMTTKGAPDLVVWFRSKAFAIEVKRPGGALREEQNETLAAILRAGGIAAVVTSPEEAMRAIGR